MSCSRGLERPSMVASFDLQLNPTDSCDVNANPGSMFLYHNAHILPIPFHLQKKTPILPLYKCN